MKKHGTGYLVGDRVTYADLMFVPWPRILQDRYPGEFEFEEFEAYYAWMKKMRERPAVKKVCDEWGVVKGMARG